MEEVKDNVNDGDDNSFLDSELQTLQAIYVNEIEVEKEDMKTTSVSIHLHPATADNLDEQYVRMTLKFILDKMYPDVLPDINIRNPRGLSDEKLESIMHDLLSIAEDKKGTSMLFEMIEAAKEHLTAENRPSGECAICLYGFDEKDIFTRTNCYHYFHSHCLARYSKNMLENGQGLESDAKSEAKDNELLCPMCRVPIQFEGSEDMFPPPVEGIDDMFNISEEIVEFQKKMADLYQKQVEKGGIIDLEAERNKYLLEISNVPTRGNTTECPKSPDASKISNETSSKTEDSGSGGSSSPSKDKAQHLKDKGQKCDFKSNGTLNKYNEPKKGEKYDRRYNKASGSNFRGAHFDKTNRRQENGSNRRFSNRASDLECDLKDSASHFNKEGSSANENISKNRESEEAAFTSEDLSGNTIPENEKSRMASSYADKKFSKPRNDTNRRYIRGYGQTNYRANNFDSYKGNRRSDVSNGYAKFNFRDRYNNPQFQRYKSSVNESEECVQNHAQESENVSWSQASEKSDFESRNRKENYNERDFHNVDRYDYNSPGRGNYPGEKNFRSDNFYYQDKRGAYSKRRGNFYHENKGYSQRNSYATSNSGECSQFSGRYETSHNERNKRYQRRNKYYPESEDKYSDYSYNRNPHTFQKDKYVKKSFNTPHSKQVSLQNESKNSNSNAGWNSGSNDPGASSDINVRPNQFVRNETHEISKRKEEKSNDKLQLSENIPEHEELKEPSNNKGRLSHNESKVLHVSDRSESLVTDVGTYGSNKSQTMLPPPPGFANPLKKVIYGLQAANPPPGFHRS